MVHSSGTWIIDHIDEDNPDRGRVLEHFFNDTTPGKFVKGAAIVTAVAGGGFVVGYGIAAFLDWLFKPQRPS